MRRLAGLLVIMVAVTFAAKGSYLLEGGKIHYRGERYEKADSLFLESIEKGMAVTESYMWHGKASIRMKKPDLAEAARAFLEVLKRDTTGEVLKKDEEASDLAQIALYYGAQEMLYDPSKADTVILFLRMGIRLDPKREQNYVLLGRFHLQNQELDETLDAAQKLEKINPESPDVAYLKGRVNLIKGNKEEAVELFKVSTARFNTEIEKLKESVGSQLGIEDEDIDKMVSAIEELEESRDSVSMDDKQKLLTEEFGLIPPQATAFLRWQSGYAGKNRQLSNAYNWLGKSYMENKKYPEADSALASALELDPENINVMWDKALALYYMGEYKKAVELLKKVEAEAEEDYYVHLWLGICYLKFEPKELEEAEKHLEKVIEIDENIADAYRNLAVIARERGDIKKASELLKKYDELIKKEGENR
jgi:tetratricopeptide (TPR) repeat protein